MHIINVLTDQAACEYTKKDYIFVKHRFKIKRIS
jgi:hypothetical protein